MFRDSIARFHRAACALAAATTLGVVPLAGCGVKGPLKLPPAAAATPAAPSAPSAETPSTPPAPAAAPDSLRDERKP